MSRVLFGEIEKVVVVRNDNSEEYAIVHHLEAVADLDTYVEAEKMKVNLKADEFLFADEYWAEGGNVVYDECIVDEDKITSMNKE